MIETAVEKSENPGGARPGKGKGFSSKASGSSTGGSIGSLSSGYAANQSDNVAKVC
jgi:hypothetical protein